MSKYLRESLLTYGPQTLSTEDLLALILRSGSTRAQNAELAQRLLTKYGGLSGLVRVDCKELSFEPGLGVASIALIKAILELGRRLNKPPTEERYQIKMSSDAANLVMEAMANLDHEELRVIVLDTKHRVIDNIPLYQGTVNSSVLRPAEIFRLAIVRKGVAIIVCHSHPSGDPDPSPEDLEVTKQLVEAGRLLDVDLVDHLVIGDHRFVSIREKIGW